MQFVVMSVICKKSCLLQHNNLRPPDGVTRKQSITKNPKIGGLPLIPIQHERNIPKNKVGTPEVSFSLSEDHWWWFSA